ncbi:MAG: hypothetical protein IKP45_13020 [Bacteroidales bacterium]|nr:hypothetical protein [Bacteroidales bacterium]
MFGVVIIFIISGGIIFLIYKAIETSNANAEYEESRRLAEIERERERKENIRKIKDFQKKYPIVFQKKFSDVKNIDSLNYLEADYVSKRVFIIWNNIFFDEIEKKQKNNKQNYDDILHNIEKIEKKDKKTDVSNKSTKQHDYCIIESNTEYANILENTPLNFQAIKNISVRQFNKYSDKDEIFQSLDRGNNVLKEEAQLYSYLNSYGNMHEAKMLSALQKFPFDGLINKHIEIIDWACGQGLASIVLLEYLRNRNITLSIDKIILIEPSEISLKRAVLHVKHFNSKCIVNTIKKDIDSISENDIRCSNNAVKIHLFSNILDVSGVKGFSMQHLISLVEQTQKGTNYFICVSPYITDAKTARIDEFVHHFSSKYYSYNNYCEIDNQKGEWKNEWSRVIRVFKVDF